MAVPRAFRRLSRAMTRSPLANEEAVPFEPKEGPVVSTRPDGRPLRAIVTKAIVEAQVAGRLDYVEQRTATYTLEDLPRLPRRGDWVHVDGERLSVAMVTSRIGVVDCILAD